MKAGQSAGKRPVYVNGIYCKSMAAGAREAARILNRKIESWEIQRVLAGRKQIPHLTISEPPRVKKSRQFAAPVKKNAAPLLRYPFGERPVERGLPQARF